MIIYTLTETRRRKLWLERIDLFLVLSQTHYIGDDNMVSWFDKSYFSYFIETLISPFLFNMNLISSCLTYDLLLPKYSTFFLKQKQTYSYHYQSLNSEVFLMQCQGITRLFCVLDKISLNFDLIILSMWNSNNI